MAAPLGPIYAVSMGKRWWNFWLSEGKEQQKVFWQLFSPSSSSSCMHTRIELALQSWKRIGRRKQQKSSFPPHSHAHTHTTSSKKDFSWVLNRKRQKKEEETNAGRVARPPFCVIWLASLPLMQPHTNLKLPPARPMFFGGRRGGGGERGASWRPIIVAICTTTTVCEGRTEGRKEEIFTRCRPDIHQSLSNLVGFFLLLMLSVFQIKITFYIRTYIRPQKASSHLLRYYYYYYYQCAYVGTHWHRPQFAMRTSIPWHWEEVRRLQWGLKKESSFAWETAACGPQQTAQAVGNECGEAHECELRMEAHVQPHQFSSLLHPTVFFSSPLFIFTHG